MKQGKEINFGTLLNAKGLRKNHHNDGSLILFLDIISDIDKNKIDAIGIQRSHT